MSDNKELNEDQIIEKAFNDYEERLKEEKENNPSPDDRFHIPLVNGSGVFIFKLPPKDMSCLLFKRPTAEISCEELDVFTQHDISTKKYQGGYGVGYYIGDSIKLESYLTNRVASKRFIKETFQHWLFDHYRFLDQYMYLSSILIYEEADMVFFKITTDDNETREFHVSQTCPIDETLTLMSTYIRSITDEFVEDEDKDYSYDQSYCSA